MLMHDICRFNALKNPHGEALVFESIERRTWAELDARVDRIADFLAHLGVRKGDRVCFLAKNCIEAIEVFLAANRIGALYAPINYRFAVPEIIQVIDDSRPKIFVAHQEFAETARDIRDSGKAGFVDAWYVVCGPAGGTGDFEAALKTAPPRSYSPGIDEGDPSWICYTGGTTGRPKGVLLSHRNMMTGAMNFMITARITANDVYFVAGALFHIALAVPVAYWLVGCKVVLSNFEPTRSLGVIAREDVTHILCTGTIFKMLVDEMDARPQPNKLALMFCGGAPVSPQLVQRAMRLFNAGVAQIYGQTEVTLMGTYLYPEDYMRGFAAPPGSADEKRMKSVGRAAPLCIARVVDETMRPLAPGEVGEIAIMSDAVMLGYANMPSQTADTIRDGWLRTGDLGFMDEDGYLHLVDRKKDMIITGGENVYSAEVELVLAQHPAISEVVVIGVPDAHWGEAVTAIVVPAHGKTPDTEEIRGFCRQRLAGYKVPKHVEFIEALPRLPTGKIAKGKLREKYWVGQERQIHGT